MTASPPPPWPATPQPYPAPVPPPTPAKKVGALPVALAVASSLIRMGPLGILAFLLLYGLASLSEDVAEWERVEPSLVAAMAAMFVVGVGLVLGQIVLAAKRRFFGLAIVAGLIAAFDATATGALLVWGEVSELGGASPVAFALFLQIAIIGLAIKEIKAAQ